MSLITFEFKDNLTDSSVWNTGETGDIYSLTGKLHIVLYGLECVRIHLLIQPLLARFTTPDPGLEHCSYHGAWGACLIPFYNSETNWEAQGAQEIKEVTQEVMSSRPLEIQ